MNLIVEILSLAKDKNDYINKHKEVRKIDNLLHEALMNLSYDVLFDKDDTVPRVDYYVNHDSVKVNNVTIFYKTQVTISTITNIAKIIYSMSFRNPDVNSLKSHLHIESYYAQYSTQQVRLYQDLFELFSKEKIHILEHSEEEHVICNLDFINTDMSLLGRQPNIGMIVFEDFFNFLDSAED